MPSYVVKPDPDTDAYVIWSTVVDCPVSILGTRTETEAHLKRCGKWGDGTRINRADVTGTSALDGDFGWKDETFLVTNCVPDFRELKRTDLLAFCHAYDRNNIVEMLRLTTHIAEEFEDDEDETP